MLLSHCVPVKQMLLLLVSATTMCEQIQKCFMTLYYVRRSTYCRLLMATAIDSMKRKIPTHGGSCTARCVELRRWTSSRSGSSCVGANSVNMSEANINLDKCYEIVLGLVEKAGALIIERNETRQEYEQKSGDIDLVTETDKGVEELLMKGISKEFPNHKFIGEEESSVQGGPKQLTNDPTWIIDPVDGTMNFVHAFPHSCISIGLVVNKVTEIGIVYNPVLKQRFTARRGKGAFLNGSRIKVSGQKDLSKALICCEYGSSRDPEKLRVVRENMLKIIEKTHGIRMLGSAALNMSMVAMGGSDVYYEFGIHAWDVCAAELLVREAGGVAIDPAGGAFDIMSRRILIASTSELAEEVSKVLTQFYPKPRDDECN